MRNHLFRPTGSQALPLP